MATKSMGTLTLNLVMQMGGFEQGADRAERALDKVGKAADRQKADLMRLLGQIDPVVAEYDRLAKAGAKLKSSLDAGLIDQATFTAFNNKLAEQRKRLDQSGDGFAYGALSAKQYQQALRGMPAQITDIVVSLQAGQNPLTVFLQQGGQIKDMFGGIGPAISGMARAVVGMINPYTMAAAAIGATAAAMYSAAEASTAFDKSLAITGGGIGLTNDQLRDMSRSIDDANSSLTKGEVTDVMNALVRSGAVAADQIGVVGEAIALMADTGQAEAKDLIKAFSKISQDPVKGVMELSDAYGKFLTQAVLDAITSARDMGDQQRAVTLAMEASAAGIKNLASDVETSTNSLVRGLTAVKNAAIGLKDSFVGLFEDETLSQQITALERRIADTRAGKDTGIIDVSRAEARLAGLKAQREETEKAAKARAEQVEEEKAYQKAVEYVTKANEKAKTTLEQVNERLKTYRDFVENIRKTSPNSPLLDPALIAKTEREILSPLNKAKTSTPKGKDPLDAQLREVQRAAKLEADIYRDRNRFIELYNSQNLLSTTDYYDAQRAALVENTATQRAALDAQIAILRGKKDAQDQINALIAEGFALEREANARMAELTLRQSGAEEQKRITDALERVNEVRTEASNILSQLQRDEERINIARQIGAEGEFESLIKLGEVRREAYEALVKQIDLYERLSAIDPAGMNDKQREALEKMAPQVDALKLQAEKLAADLDPLGKRINGIFRDAFADAFTDFVTGSKSASEAFAAFGRSVINQMAQIAAQRMALQIFSMFAGGFSGGASGSFFTPDSNAAIMGGYGAFSYSSGGYTGPGGKYDPAGIVHAGEYVFSQEDVRAAGGPAGMDALRKGLRGYANGGYVASPSAPTMPAQAPAAAPRIINVLDPSLVGDYLATDAGEEIILNIMQRNQRAFM